MKNQEKMPKIDTESMMLMNTWNTCKTIILLTAAAAIFK
jgi:hypothetical protein